MVQPPAPRPYPSLPVHRADALNVRRYGDRWVIERITNGRSVAFTVSREELEDFIGIAASKLAMDREGT